MSGTNKSSQPEDPSPPQKIKIENQNEALSILIKGIEVAQSKGAFTLDEAAILVEARSFFAKPMTSQSSSNKTD